jgi:3-hydroxyisobutyrate dehydrogenase
MMRKDTPMTTQHHNEQQIAFIGLGAMGSRMAARLVQAGFRVTGYDINPRAMQQLVTNGGHSALHPADAARQASVLLLIVASAEQVEEVLFGQHGALTTLPQGCTVLLSSTVPPTYTQALGARLQERGYPLLDCPVSGGVKGAEEGTLTAIASGSAEAFAACESLLPVVASQVYRLGDAPGQGSTVKIINQLLVGVHLATTIEAVALAVRLGVDLERMYEVIRNSSGVSRIFESRVPDLIAGKQAPGGTVDIFVKDLGIVQEVGKQAHFPLPMAASAHQQFLMGAAAGLGHERDTALLKLMAQLYHLDLPEPAVEA